ncbi:MAG: DNA-directed DNA polymerase [Candidatus Micrarchaeales archaeon]|nr:DNA-directed DNA polymerase [Candidatus Micrarchaeales archaeon]
MDAVPKTETILADGSGSSERSLDCVLLDVDYISIGDDASIRLTLKGADGKAYEVFDPSFKPYFLFVPGRKMEEDEMMDLSAADPSGLIKPVKIRADPRTISGRKVDSYRVYVKSPSQVPKLSAAMKRHGECYEYDIPFAKRYVLDSGLFPLTPYTVILKTEGKQLVLTSIEPNKSGADVKQNLMGFDIEVYNPLGMPRPDFDPVIMISYMFSAGGKSGKGVITYKKINRPFVEVVRDETAMIKRFVDVIRENDIDIITGYNSANFDIKYLLDRARKLRIEFDISRFEGSTKLERHGLVERVKCAGRVHVDMYTVVRFIAIVGSAEYILKLNSYTLDNVYHAVTGKKIWNVSKSEMQKNSVKYWDGDAEQLGMLADYNLADSEALLTVYNAFVPIMIALAKTTGDQLSDVAVSTTGQLCEFVLMRYAQEFKEIIPNKPDETEIKRRMYNPIEGAYVKTPEPGIYENLAMFDFRGLYPSIIISHNVDPSSLCTECNDYFESPTGAKFDKNRKSTIPTILKILMDQRAQVKKEFKKNPGNIELGASSMALKILSNTFYGYLGYARSRWYSRECASSITAWSRQYIKETIAAAEKAGFGVLYGDTDSLVAILGEKTKDDALAFMKSVNDSLPQPMELELEDFYTRGVFVGKKTDKEAKGAKKKYALIAENGRIKIRGFELVRRDWSHIARDTQRRVLEAILKEGSRERAAEIVRDVVKRLKEGKVPLSELVINTQLRKSIDAYDARSPELAAAKKAVERGIKTRDEVEHSVIGYIVTRHGASVSDRAELEELAQDYDPDYYINNQVLPATMRILKELDFDEDELKGLGKQKKLL